MSDDERPDLDDVETWKEIADDLYHVIHCSNDEHRIEAERRYLAARKLI